MNEQDGSGPYEPIDPNDEALKRESDSYGPHSDSTRVNEIPSETRTIPTETPDVQHERLKLVQPLEPRGEPPLPRADHPSIAEAARRAEQSKNQ